MFAILDELPLVWRLAMVAFVVVAIGGAYVAWHHHVYQQGYSAAIADVAKADQAALDRVKQGQGDIANCRAGGGEWDVTTGECK